MKIKRMLAVVLTIILVIGVMPMSIFTTTANAATSGTTGDCSWKLDGTVLTISGSGAMADYNVFWSSGASWSRDITEVIICEGVTSIGEFSFWNYSKLSTVTIPKSLTEIGIGAFGGCSSLKTLYYNALNCNSFYEAYLEPNIEYYYAYGPEWSNLETVVFGEGVNTIGDYMFYGCSNLVSISIPNGVTKIGDRAFCECSSLTSMNFPNGVTDIGECAFFYCSSLTSITLPVSIATIGSRAFEGCSNLSINYQGSWVDRQSIVGANTSVFKYATWSYGKSEEIYYTYHEDELTATISDCAPFAKNAVISKVVVKNGQSYIVTEIGDSAFSDCDLLESIIVPNSVTDIGKNAFNNCRSLTDVYYGGEAQQRIVIDEGNNYLKSAEWHYNICDLDSKTEHKYKNNCDKTCENCEYIRDKIQHTYDGACDSKCNYCGYLRAAYHEFNNSVDLICNKCSFERKNPAPISVCVSEPCKYDNSNTVIPDIFVYYKNQALKENVDFLVTYSNNNKIGEAQISIEGIGDYEGIKREVTFEIVPKDISSAEVTVASCSYTGNPLKPSVTVTLDGVVLSSSNYNAYYYDNTLAGTAYVVIVGKGNYCGMIKKSFTIGKFTVVASDTKYKLSDGSVCNYSIINASTGATVKSDSFNAPGGSYADFTGVSSGTYYVKYYTRSSTIQSTMSGAYYVWTGSTYGPYTTPSISYTSPNTPAPSYTLPKSLIAEKPIAIDCRTLLFTVSSKNSYDCLDDITWTSSNENLATISKGVLTLKKAGNFKVTATIGDVSASWDISIDELELSNKANILSYNPTTKKAEVVYGGEILKEGTDYTIITQNKGNATIVTVTGENLFSGSLTEIFYSDTGYKYCSDKITVSQLPEKLEYKANKENLDLDGAKLLVDLGNNQSMTVNITEDMVSGYDNTVAGEQEIVVTYCGQTTIFKVEVYDYMAGDLTGDDKINSLDGLMLLRHLNGWTLNIASPEAMDVNADGKVNSLDGLMLMRYLNGWNITLG